MNGYIYFTFKVYFTVFLLFQPQDSHCSLLKNSHSAIYRNRNMLEAWTIYHGFVSYISTTSPYIILIITHVIPIIYPLNSEKIESWIIYNVLEHQQHIITNNTLSQAWSVQCWTHTTRYTSEWDRVRDNNNNNNCLKSNIQCIEIRVQWTVLGLAWVCKYIYVLNWATWKNAQPVWSWLWISSIIHDSVYTLTAAFKNFSVRLAIQIPA